MSLKIFPQGKPQGIPFKKATEPHLRSSTPPSKQALNGWLTRSDPSRAAEGRACRRSACTPAAPPRCLSWAFDLAASQAKGNPGNPQGNLLRGILCLAMSLRSIYPSTWQCLKCLVSLCYLSTWVCLRLDMSLPCYPSTWLRSCLAASFVGNAFAWLCL